MADTIGQAAYEAYCARTHGRSLVTGASLPPWAELPRGIQDAWNDAGGAAWAWKEDV